MKVLVVVNNMDTLFYEEATSEDPESQSISVGFFMKTDNVYGIPARGSTFHLNNTNTDNFELYNSTTDSSTM